MIFQSLNGENNSGVKPESSSHVRLNLQVISSMTPALTLTDSDRGCNFLFEESEFLAELKPGIGFSISPTINPSNVSGN
jgi:hypothetical protein